MSNRAKETANVLVLRPPTAHARTQRRISAAKLTIKITNLVLWRATIKSYKPPLLGVYKISKWLPDYFVSSKTAPILNEIQNSASGFLRKTETFFKENEIKYKVRAL